MGRAAQIPLVRTSNGLLVDGVFVHELRVMGKVDQRGPDECWPWKSGRNRDQYGVFSIKWGGTTTRKLQAHRLAYVLQKGAIPPGLLVRHSCHNPPCCNGAHLEPGTHADNMRDMLEAGRSTHGERNPRAKLTESDVRAAKMMRKAGMTLKHIAKAFGVHLATIDYATRGVTWGKRLRDPDRSRE